MNATAIEDRVGNIAVMVLNERRPKPTLCLDVDLAIASRPRCAASLGAGTRRTRQQKAARTPWRIARRALRTRPARPSALHDHDVEVLAGHHEGALARNVVALE